MDNKLILFLFASFQMYIIACGSSTTPAVEQSLSESIVPEEKQGPSIYHGSSTAKENGSLLNEIVKLEGNWELEETGKGYWIGYTDNMKKIASYKDEAIAPLLLFIETTNSFKAKYGAVLTLHLIGIEGTPAGRFYEEFKNQKARKALLKLLKKEELQYAVMLLLIRDPWLSDVPQLMETMAESQSSCWPIVNGLLRYELENIPIRHKIPLHIGDAKVRFVQSEEKTESENLWASLKDIKGAVGENVIIEKDLTSQDLFGDIYFKYGDDGSEEIEKELSSLIEDIVGNRDLAFSYLSLGNRLQYYVENEKVFVCSPITAKKRWLMWWKKGHAR